MSRLLLLIAIAIVVYLLVKSYQRKNVPQQDKAVSEDMVRCAQCGLHFPKSESIQSGGHYFCSAEHRDAYRK